MSREASQQQNIGDKVHALRLEGDEFSFSFGSDKQVTGNQSAGGGSCCWEQYLWMIFFPLRVEFLLKTDGGYPIHAVVFPSFHSRFVFEAET